MQIKDLAGIAIIFVVVAVVIGIGADVLTELRSGTNNNTADFKYNASQYGLEGLEELGSWLPTIAIVVAAAVIIGIIAMYFAMR